MGKKTDQKNEYHGLEFPLFLSHDFPCLTSANPLFLALNLVSLFFVWRSLFQKSWKKGEVMRQMWSLWRIFRRTHPSIITICKYQGFLEKSVRENAPLQLSTLFQNSQKVLIEDMGCRSIKLELLPDLLMQTF